MLALNIDDTLWQHNSALPILRFVIDRSPVSECLSVQIDCFGLEVQTLETRKNAFIANAWPNSWNEFTTDNIKLQFFAIKSLNLSLKFLYFKRGKGH